MARKSFLVALLLALLLGACLGGRILNGDFFVDYANVGLMTQMSFSFMLENSITSTDYIRIAMPFQLHALLTPSYPASESLSMPQGVQVTWQPMNEFLQLTSTAGTAQVLTEAIDSSNYFLRLYGPDRKVFVPLAASTWIRLSFKIQDPSALQFQKSSSVLQIQISTVSSVLSNAMVYDENLAFIYFQLASTPSQSISLIVTPYNFGTSGGYLLTEKTYSIFMDMDLKIPSNYFGQTVVLKFLISVDKTFKFTGSCSSVAKTNSPKVAALLASTYTCSVDTSTNIMKIDLSPTALLTQTTYRFTVDIINPPRVVKGVSIFVRAVSKDSGVVIGFGKASQALSTNQLYVTNQVISLAWGLKPDALLPFDARIFRGSLGNTYKPYNSIQVQFSLSQTTSASTELKIIINIPSQDTASVLNSGYSTNLPAALNKQVKCVTQFSTVGKSRRIGCTGVGQLLSTKSYFVGWKMFFPYDDFQSSIDCVNFGTLTIYSVTTITALDDAFVLGRGDDFLAFLSSSPNFYLLGRNSAFINSMKTYSNTNLIVRSTDFQQFLSSPDSIFVTNRPSSYAQKSFNDLFVITQNLNFMTYMSQFTDIYIAAMLKRDTDIVKGYDTIPLVALTTVKNTLTILTSNSKDWTDFITNINPLVSSTTATSGLVPGANLKKKASVDQSLVFSFKAPYSDVTSFSSASNTPITNGWGMMIMMSPKIAVSTTTAFTISETTSSLTVSASTISDPAEFNQYTLITLRGTMSDHLQTSFKSSAAQKTSFGLFPLKISSFSSLFAGSDNMDILIATIDGIDGPTNKIKYNGFFLINGFSGVDSNVGTLNYQLVNFKTSTSMDGSQVPTMLRVKGSVSGVSNFGSLAIFFDMLTPFYSNYYTSEVYCFSTEGASVCRYYNGANSLAEKRNYQTLSRIQIPITTPATNFDIFIPITYATSQTTTNFYLGYLTVNVATGLQELQYMESLRPLGTSVGLTNGNYGPTVSAAQAGQVVTNLVLKANAPVAITLNSGLNIGAAFTYFSKWDFIRDSTLLGWSSIGTCYKMTYLYYYTNYAAYISSGAAFTSSYQIMTGLVCPVDLSNSVSSAQITISSGYLPSKWGLRLPGYGAYSNADGSLVSLNTNYQTVGAAPVVLSTNMVPPIMGPLLAKSVGEWTIRLPVNIDGNIQVAITGQPVSPPTNIPFVATGTCSITADSVLTPFTCSFTSSTTQIIYVISVTQSSVLNSGANMGIVHYGLTTTSSYNTVSINVVCSSLENSGSPGALDVVFSASSVSFPWQGPTYLGASTLTLSDFNQWTANKGVYSSFMFTFTLLSKGLDPQNRVNFNLGQFAIDNAASAVNPTCKVYLIANQAKDYSHDWAAVDTSKGLNNLQLRPKATMTSSQLSYVLKCTHFLSTSSSSARSIEAKIVNALSAQTTGQLQSSNQIALPRLNTVTGMARIVFSKKYTLPSTLAEVTFLITSPGVTSDSYLYISFPSYYPSGLGPAIHCYSSGEIFCSVENRNLNIKYIGTYPVGTTFSIKVTGISNSINYNSGTFTYTFDDDKDPQSILATGVFSESVTSSVLSIQNFPGIQILSLSQSSAYLRADSVKITAQFFLQGSLPNIQVGQALFFIFPPIFSNVLRFTTPTCVLNLKSNSLKNYINGCLISGIRLKMPFLDNLVLDSVYVLTIGGIINPTDPSANSYRYSIQISALDDNSLVAKSYPTFCNYVMPVFIADPIRRSLNYYTKNGPISSMTSVVNIQSEEVYISEGINLATSAYNRNARLSPVNSLSSVPATISLSAGTNPFPIRFTALASGVNYVYFTKSGDGEFYSNLPPLIITTDKNYNSVLELVETSFSLPIGPPRTEYTITLTLPSSLLPMSEISMRVVVAANSGLTLKVDPTTIVFYPAKNTAQFQLYISDTLQWTTGSSTTIKVTPVGTDTFSNTVTITLNAIAQVSSSVSLTLTPTTPDKKSYSFTALCSGQGKFVYHVSRYFSYNTTACVLSQSEIQKWSVAASIGSLRLSETYYECSDYFNTINVPSTLAAIPFTVSNLMASTTYLFRGYCKTSSGTLSSVSEQTFTTQSNGGSVSRVDFNFVSVLTTTQKIKLVCALALYFSIDYKKVSTWDGYYCSELLSRLLQQEVDVSVSSSPYKLGITGSPAVKTTTVYFGVNTNMNTDNSKTGINTAVAGSALLTNINQNVAGLPQLISYSANVAANRGSNDFVGNFTISVGPTYLYATNIQLQRDGLVYFILGNSSTWTRPPVISEIKSGSGPNGQPPVMHRILTYRTSSPKATLMSFVGLTSGNYSLYATFADDNPFDDSNMGSIKSFNITLEVPKWGSISSTILYLTATILVALLL